MMNVSYFFISAVNYNQKHAANSKIGLEYYWIFFFQEWEARRIIGHCHYTATGELVEGWLSLAWDFYG